MHNGQILNKKELTVDGLRTILLNTTDQIVLIGSTIRPGTYPNQFEHVDDYILQNNISNSDVIFLLNPEHQDEQILKLRTNKNTKLNRIYVTHETPISRQITCGVITEEYQSLAYYSQKTEKLITDKLEDIRYFALSFMWVFDKTLTPRLSPTSPTLYTYDLLDFLTGSSDESKKVLSYLINKELVSKSRLVNRIRQCKSCSSGHLNFVDVCPKCKSLETEAFASLHCFKCGFVGKQQRFNHKQGLSCPNCLTNLRHIGVDYDRPIESISCVPCEHVFNEHEVVAECLNCLTLNSTDSLVPLNLYEYELSELGINYIKNGELKNASLPTLGEQLSTQHIFWLIDWVNKLAKRHDQKHSVLALRAVDLDNYIAKHGELAAADRIDEIQSRLLSLLRTTDACTNYSEHGILMLLPLTSSDNIKHILAKLKEIQETQVTSPLMFEVRYIELPFEQRLNSSVEIIDILNSKAPILI